MKSTSQAVSGNAIVVVLHTGLFRSVGYVQDPAALFDIVLANLGLLMQYPCS